MCFNNGRFFVGRCLLLSLAKLLDQAHRAAFETSLEATASTRVDELNASYLLIFSQSGNTYFHKLHGMSDNGKALLVSNTHILIAHVQKFVQLDTTVREGAKCALFLEISGDLRVCYIGLREILINNLVT